MGFTPAPKIATASKAAATGISMSLSEGSKTRLAVVRLTFNAETQNRLFGRAINPETDRMELLIGRGQDEGRAQIRLCAEGDNVIKGGIKGSVSVRVGRWDLLPEGKYPGSACREIGDPEKQGDQIAVLLMLPDWASPMKRQIAAKHGMSAKRHSAEGGAK